MRSSIDLSQPEFKWRAGGVDSIPIKIQTPTPSKDEIRNSIKTERKSRDYIKVLRERRKINRNRSPNIKIKTGINNSRNLEIIKKNCQSTLKLSPKKNLFYRIRHSEADIREANIKEKLNDILIVGKGKTILQALRSITPMILRNNY